MKYFSFKLLILCFIIPPILFLFSLEGMEKFMTHQYAREIQEVCTGDTTELFAGSIALTEALNNNIDRYLSTKGIIAMGVSVAVTVTSRGNLILYPTVLSSNALTTPLPREIAAENFDLLTHGLTVKVDVAIEWTGILAVTTFSLFLLISLVVLYEHYRKGVNRALVDEMKKSSEIDQLMEKEKKNASRLKSLEKERDKISADFEKTHKELKGLEQLKKDYASKLKSLGKEKKKITTELTSLSREFEKIKISATNTEEEMLEEIMVLEEKIKQYHEEQSQEKEQDTRLLEMVRRYEKAKSKEEKSKARQVDIIRKRFTTFYKNVLMMDKALFGFAGLTEELKLKGEEVIHNLNADPDKVPVKRKMAIKKGRRTVLEVPFAYHGRLYFSKAKDNRIEVLTMGTKNSQTKDLAFLNSLTPE